MCGNFNGLNVQVLGYDEAQHLSNFGTTQNGGNKQVGVYCSDKNLHHLLDYIVNCPRQFENCNPKTLAVSSGVDNVLFHWDKFEVFLDVRGYAPEELLCTVLSQYIEVIGKKVASPGELVGRSMSRKYALPQAILPHQSRCYLASESVLVISAPWAPKPGPLQYIQV